MRTPRQETDWRPRKDIGGRFELDPVGLAKAQEDRPKTAEDARNCVKFMGLQIVGNYEGYSDLQAEIIEDEAKRLFPEVFRLAEAVNTEPLRLISNQ